MSGVECVLVSKEDIGTLVEMALKSKDEPRPESPVPPELLTMEDIKNYYGIGKTKWRSGVAIGMFPSPVDGFEKPKRWSRGEVEATLRIGRNHCNAQA